MHIVEIRREGDGGLAEMMRQMRGWLDHHQVVPYLFRIGGNAFHFEFVTEDEATAFAIAFHGHVVGELEVRAAA